MWRRVSCFTAAAAALLPRNATASLRACSNGTDLEAFTFPFKVEDLVKGQRRALAKAITIVESDNPQHAHKIGFLLREVNRLRSDEAKIDPSKGLGFGHAETTIQKMKKMTPRIAISGSPGAGKSCFIEAFGTYLTDKLGLRVGVIAVDPSSQVSMGSILGDKTRMEKLSMHPNAYVRPSPSRGHLGGVTARCWEVMKLMEAANFDVILVETVGVGQSEIDAKYMTDVMLLLVPPASGDELQGIKKGIVEVADMIIVTKNDGERKLLAQQTKAAYARAVQFREDCHVDKPVVAVSSEENVNIDKAWESLSLVWQRKENSGVLKVTRQQQRRKHFISYFEQELLRRAKETLDTNGGVLHLLEEEVAAGKKAPREAGELALDALFQRGKW